MAPELNQMSFRKIKELILEVVNMVDNTIFISVKDIMKTLSVSESKAYMTIKQAAEKWDITTRRIQFLCSNGCFLQR